MGRVKGRGKMKGRTRKKMKNKANGEERTSNLKNALDHERGISLKQKVIK